jgi:hypothetical protein
LSEKTIPEKSEPVCLWCGAAKPATKAGWIKHTLSHGIEVFFCSKKHLASATLSGNGKTLDIGKIAVHQTQKERGAILTRFRAVLGKDRMDENDYAVFLRGLNNKQKHTLALIGQAALMKQFRFNPGKILAEINLLGK